MGALKHVLRMADGSGNPPRMGSPRFDAFRVEESGGICWIGTAENRAAAEAMLRRFAAEHGSQQFVLLDQATGAKTTLKAADLFRNEAETNAAD